MLSTIFQVNLNQIPHFSSFTSFRMEPTAISGTHFLWAEHASCHPTNSVKALKETQSTEPTKEITLSDFLERVRSFLIHCLTIQYL